MRYVQSKEQSSELLRLALPLMAKQMAGYHPVSYAIWYEHVAGINPMLSQLLDERLGTNQPLSEEETYKLHERHVRARETELVEKLKEHLRTLLEDAAASAAAVGSQAGEFCKVLEEGRRELSDSLNPEALGQILSRLVQETTRMQSRTEAISIRLEAKAREVSTLTQELERAQTEALTDPLSGLKNRRGLERDVEDLRATEGGLAGVALLLADIDHFKQINDTYGHLFGDKVIRAVAQVLHANIKGRDVAARIGGEEFAVLLPGTSLGAARLLADRLRIAIERSRIHRGGDKAPAVGNVTISIGVAAGLADDAFENLMDRADRALYAAKRGGRNRVCLADSTAGRNGGADGE